MSSAGPIEPGEWTHPIVHFSSRLAAALDGLTHTPAWSMTAEEERSVLVELAASAARLTELRLRVLVAAHRDDIGKVDGSASTDSWVAAATRQPRGAARADLRLGLALDERFERTRRALAGGRLDAEQARVVVTSVDALPERVDAADRARAERHLVREGRHHDAKALKVIGRHVFEVIDPEGADEELGRKLAAEEREARRRTFLRLRENDDGTTDGWLRIPTLHAHMLGKALDAFTSPRRLGPDGRTRADGTTMDRPELWGRGLCELLERFPADRLPRSGGINATVVVTLSLDQLRAELAAASLDTGGAVSAGEARRLACEAGIIPAVLDGRSMPLDLGREQRLHSRYQRIALGLKRTTCAEKNCQRPVAWCEAHHRVPWARGGGTSVENGELLCSWHHHRAHDPDYDVTRSPDGGVRFHRRT